MRVKQLLGRTRLALSYLVGQQSMIKGVDSCDDDFWIVSYPKSGNTWTRFLVANLISRGEPVDWSTIERQVPDIYYGRDPQFRKLPRPRYFKSHEAYQPSYRRVVFIVRDPRDVAVSYYHFVRKSKWLPENASMDEFMALFLAGRVDPYGSWGENVGSWLGARRNTPNFMTVRYEDLLADTEGQLALVAAMMGLNVDRGQLRAAVENSTADNMRALEKKQQNQHKLTQAGSDIPFVRAAKADQWQTELPADYARQIEAIWGESMRELGYL